MRRVPAILLLVMATMLTPMLAPDGASARSFTVKQVERFVAKHARTVGATQPSAYRSLFPDMTIKVWDSGASCRRLFRIRGRGIRYSKSKWQCYWHVGLEEESPSDRYAYVLRKCGNIGKEKSRKLLRPLQVRRTRSGKLQIRKGWILVCPLDGDLEDITESPAVEEKKAQSGGLQRSEPIVVPRLRNPPKLKRLPSHPLSSPAPPGAPGAPPPGPLTTEGPKAGASAKARAAQYDILLGCSPWGRWERNPAYWIYGCFWEPRALPGSSPGIFNRVTYYNLYYWAGNDAYGRPIGQLFESGSFGAPAGSLY